jgi:hypothetical protein
MGVTSSIRPTFKPILAKVLIAVCAPGPGELDLSPPGARTFTRTFVKPFSFKTLATRSAARIAAYGEDSSRAAFTTIPPEHFAMVSAPVMSVAVMMMLL